MSEITDTVKSVLSSYCDVSNFSEDDSLIEAGVIDSLNVLNILTKLEHEFNIEFSDSDFSIDKFKTINKIKLTVESKLHN